jgi:ankyrin repeat protein
VSDSGDKYVDVFAKEYERNITRILEQKDQHQKRRAMLTMGAIREAVRPLSTEELAAMHSIRVDGKPKNMDVLEWEEIAGSCYGLVEVDELTNVSFIHASLLEYLKSNRGQGQITNYDERIGKICVAYLTLGSCDGKVCADKPSLKARTDQWPFLDYAARYWSVHLRASEKFYSDTHVRDDLKAFYQLAMDFLRNDKNVECAVQITMFEDRAFKISPQQASKLSKNSQISILIVKEDFQHHVLDPFAPNLATGLHLACELGLEELVERLLAVNDNPAAPQRMLSRQDSMQHTPLHLAVVSSQLSITKILLKAGAPCNAVNAMNVNPFHLALELSHHEIAKIILEHSADQAELVNTATTASGRISSERTELRFRISEGVVIPQQPIAWVDVHGRTAFVTAARTGDIDILEILLSVPGVHKHVRDSAGEQCLHRAAKKGHLQVVKMLVQAGLAPGDKVTAGRRVGSNALHRASPYDRPGNVKVVAWLCEEYPELCYDEGQDGQTPLHRAAMYGATENVQKILTCIDPSTIGSLINKADKEGNTALHLAATSGSSTCLQALLQEESVDIMARNKDKLTPLQRAARFGVSSCIQGLLQRTEKIVLQNDSELLVMAARSNNLRTFTTLWSDDNVSREGVSKAYPDLEEEKMSKEILELIQEWQLD